MKKFFQTSTILLFIFSVLLIFSSCERRGRTIRGYINPGAERSFEWVKDKFNGFEPYKTVEVTISFTGEKVQAIIPNDVLNPYFLEYEDYPPAEGRKIFVALKRSGYGQFTIVHANLER